MPQRDDGPPRDPQQIIDDQARRIEQLQNDLRRSEAERQRLRRENEKLKADLEAARRTSARQAAPFARETRVAQPKRPGRKPGAAYGRRAHRSAPPYVDETYDAPLPAECPGCAGRLRETDIATQYQEELPVQRPLVRAFHVHIGTCTQCRRRVQGRHPLQTSDALGAAAAQLGPQAIAFAVLLNKRCGLSYGRIAALLRDRFRLTVTCGGLVQAVHRAARLAQPTYAHLAATVRGSPVVTADETSWRVDADLQWLWAFVTPEPTVYAIQPGRGLAQAAVIIGQGAESTPSDASRLQRLIAGWRQGACAPWRWGKIRDTNGASTATAARIRIFPHGHRPGVARPCHPAVSLPQPRSASGVRHAARVLSASSASLRVLRVRSAWQWSPLINGPTA